jgi:glycosyltransferase involved in cell wall biosynthesis
MACGLPVVVSDQVGLCREVEKAKAGLVVSTDVDQLTATLLKLLDDPGLCLEMGENGRRLASTEFSWDVIAANALVHYNQVLGTS